jgi:hypothetical protein
MGTTSVATKLDELFPGVVDGVNVKLPANVAGGVREVDIVLLDKFVIQVKGGKANHLFNQMTKTTDTLVDKKIVIGYAPDDFSPRAWAGAAEQGVPIARNFDELVQIVKELA